jgi:hypothetical protein
VEGTARGIFLDGLSKTKKIIDKDSLSLGRESKQMLQEYEVAVLDISETTGHLTQYLVENIYIYAIR